MDPDDRPVTAVAMLGHGMFHTYDLAIPIFLAIWLVEFGTTTATLGLVAGLGYALVGVGAVPGGALSDAYGSRRLVLASMVGMAGGFLLMSRARGLLGLGAALVVWGAAGSLYHPAGLSLLSRGTGDRELAFAYHGVAGNVGTGLGPLLVAVLLAVLDWRLVAGLLVLPGVAGLAVSWRIGPLEAAGGPERPTGAGRGPVDLGGVLASSRGLATRAFVTVLGVSVLMGLYYRGAFTFLPTVLSGLPGLEPVAAFGTTLDPAQYLYSGLLMVGAVGQMAGGKLAVVLRTERALAVTFGLLVLATAAFLPASRAGVVPLAAVASAIGFLHFANGPITQVLIARYVTADTHGLSYGYTYLAMYGIGAAGAALAGYVLGVWDATGLFALLAAIAAAGLGLAVVLDRGIVASSGRRQRRV